MANSMTSRYAGSKIRLIRTPEKNFWIEYKDYTLDIGDRGQEYGIMEALKWFGDIRFKEGTQAKDDSQ
jgi:hypothetical protein